MHPMMTFVTADAWADESFTLQLAPPPGKLGSPNLLLADHNTPPLALQTSFPY